MPDVTLEEIRKAVEEQGKAFEEFKATNDDRLKDEAKKAVDPLMEEKLGKINEFLNTYEDLNQKITKQLDERKAKDDEFEQALDRLEASIKRRFDNGGADDPETKQQLEVFEKWARFGSIRDQAVHEKAVTAEELKVLSVSDDTTGGYFAPAEYVRDIIKDITEISPVRSLVRVRTTGNRSIQVPKRTGQFSATWVSELATRSERTGLEWGLEEIPTHELTAEVYISMQDLEDSIFDLEAELNMEFSEQLALAEGTAIVTGNANGKPEGWQVNADVSYTASGDANEIRSTASGTAEADGLITLQAAVKTGYRANARWVLNRTTIGKVRRLKDSQNNYVWRLGIAEGAPNSILGDPYVEVPDMPDEATNAYPIAYGDFRRAYTMVDRIRMSVLRDPYTRANVGQVKFVARRRVGGQVVQAEAIRKLKCATS